MSVPLPVPARLREGMETDVIKELPLDGDIRWMVRRALEAAYAEGYRDGHLAGERETRNDLRAERDAEVAAAKEETR